MTRHELKNLILECIDEKMDDISQKVVEVQNYKFLQYFEMYKELRKDVDVLALDSNIEIPSNSLPF